MASAASVASVAEGVQSKTGVLKPAKSELEIVVSPNTVEATAAASMVLLGTIAAFAVLVTASIAAAKATVVV